MIPPTSTRLFRASRITTSIDNPKTHIVFDDARHYLMTTTDKYDIIASDPLDVFVKGTAALYSKEYFEAVKRHLNPGGMFTLYVPLYEKRRADRQERTGDFFRGLPLLHGLGQHVDGQGYDMVFMGHLEPLKSISMRCRRGWTGRITRRWRSRCAKSAVTRAMDLFSNYAGQNADLGPGCRGADQSRWRSALQYLGGWGINSDMADVLYKQMLSYRRTPNGLFSGSPDKVQALMQYLAPGANGEILRRQVSDPPYLRVAADFEDLSQAISVSGLDLHPDGFRLHRFELVAVHPLEIAFHLG